MHQAEDGRRKGSGAAIAVIVLLLLPLLYVLSIGPAVMISEQSRSDASVEIFVVVYYPVLWLYDDTPLQAPLDRYLGLWA